MNNKQLRREKARARGDLAATRFFVVFAVCAAAILVFLKLNIDIGDHQAYFILNGLIWVRLGLAVLTAAAGVWFAVMRIRKADETMSFCRSYIVFPTVGALFALSLVYDKVLFTGVIVALLGYLLIYFIGSFYPRVFLVFTLFTLFGIGCVYVYSGMPSISGSGSLYGVAAKLLAYILPVALSAVLAFRIRPVAELLAVGNVWSKKYRIAFFIMSAIMVAGCVVMTLTAGAAFYSAVSRAVLALCALFYLGCAVHCTIRMM